MPPAEPFRTTSYLGASLYSVLQQNVGQVVRIIAGNDSLVGNFGLRVSGDITINGTSPGNSVALAGTYRTTIGQVDGYVGIGGGLNLSNQATFGEGVLGVDYRLLDNVALFGEARSRYYFDGSNANIGSIAFGVQLRF